LITAKTTETGFKKFKGLWLNENLRLIVRTLGHFHFIEKRKDRFHSNKELMSDVFRIPLKHVKYIIIMQSSNAFHLVKCISRPDSGLVEALKSLPVANIADAIGKPCPLTMDPAIRPAYLGIKLAGPAVTAMEAPDCNLMTHAAIDLMCEGDVLVVDVGGYTGSAVGGFLMSRKMISKRVEGVDGAWRDHKEINDHSFSVFARAWTPSGPHKNLPGSVNVPITCGGVVVKPGDIIVGDDDGVVVIPLDLASAVLKKASEINQHESKIINDERKEVVEAPSPYASEEKLRQLGVTIG
jgi:4-hydroxy-4-methyl-2-oxoglutarate aldolase